ncbi:MAG TPA: hypothetical protein VNX86_05080 [Rhizomicrobium sp.]|jgi:uncharacterized protein YbjQ (UPF0145 family)|nr:hypothetical protein [Rhizomicrobium sp.]
MHFIGRAFGLILSVASAIVCSPFVSPAVAGDVFNLPIDRAMSMSQTNGRLDGTVKFYFGQTPHPEVMRRFGNFVANEKTNAVGKTDLSECAWVFQSALLSLQKRAHALGANAVINIHSFYKKEDVSSETEIPCHTGFLMAGIALKGDLVTVAGK